MSSTASISMSHAGELLAIIGPNGAGKSTLLRALDGLQAAHRGRVEVDGRSVSGYRRRDLARVVSFVPQTDVPADDYTVRAFVEMGRYPHLATWSALTADDRRAVDEALELTEIDHLAARPMKTLSGGERQRVWIAAALAQGGTILLLDEPTSFLDYRHQVQILDLLGRLHAEGGYTVVAVTHDLNGLVADADSVLALVDGRVEFSGTAGGALRRRDPGADLRQRFCPRGWRAARSAPGDAGEERLVNRGVGLAVLLVGAVVVLLTAPLIGPVSLPLSALTDPFGSDPSSRIFWQIRVPRVVAAFLGGAGLAVGGAVFQAVFRNPLATPYILGVAAGASFGVAAVARIGAGVVILGLGLQSWSALGGALLAVGVVWMVTRLRPDAATSTLLLAGVSLNFFFSSLILFLQYTASFADAYRVLRWLMGGLGGVDVSAVIQMTPFVVLEWRSSSPSDANSICSPPDPSSRPVAAWPWRRRERRSSWRHR